MHRAWGYTDRIKWFSKRNNDGVFTENIRISRTYFIIDHYNIMRVGEQVYVCILFISS